MKWRKPKSLNSNDLVEKIPIFPRWKDDSQTGEIYTAKKK